MKFLILLLSLFSLSICMAQPSKGTTDCNELKFWVEQVQNGFKKVSFDTMDSLKTAVSRSFKGFDTTEYFNNPSSNEYSITGISFRFKKTAEAKLLFAKLSKMVSTCLGTMKLKKQTLINTSTAQYELFDKKFSNGKALVIELRWMMPEEMDLESETPQSPNLWCKIFYTTTP